MDRAKEYLRRKAEAEAEAAKADDFQVKKSWQRIADQWDDLARQVHALPPEGCDGS
jgi:hypothetical protein